MIQSRRLHRSESTVSIHLDEAESSEESLPKPVARRLETSEKGKKLQGCSHWEGELPCFEKRRFWKRSRMDRMSSVLLIRDEIDNSEGGLTDYCP